MTYWRKAFAEIKAEERMLTPQFTRALIFLCSERTMQAVDAAREVARSQPIYPEASELFRLESAVKLASAAVRDTGIPFEHWIRAEIMVEFPEVRMYVDREFEGGA